MIFGKYIKCIAVGLVISINSTFGQELTRKEYITKYSPLAVKQMHQYKIPASITLAQGILESNNGNSRLATKANNHFGIKCHGWEGKKIFADDDKKQIKGNGSIDKKITQFSLTNTADINFYLTIQLQIIHLGQRALKKQDMLPTNSIQNY